MSQSGKYLHGDGAIMRKKLLSSVNRFCICLLESGRPFSKKRFLILLTAEHFEIDDDVHLNRVKACWHSQPLHVFVSHVRTCLGGF